MKNYSFAVALIFLCIATVAQAGFGGMDKIEYESDNSSVFGPHLIIILLGAAIGCFSERASNKYKISKEGIQYTSGYLGGEVGAFIGCFGMLLIIGLSR